MRFEVLRRLVLCVSQYLEGMWCLYHHGLVAQEELIFAAFLLRSCETTHYESLLLTGMMVCSSIYTEPLLSSVVRLLYRCC